MIKVVFSVLMLLVLISQVNAGDGKENKHKGQVEIKVHAVTDLSHEFSFYGDHRFHQQYLPGQKGVTNWCSLFNFDFSNANLLILLSCADQIRYSSEDIRTIQQFLKAGGGVVILGDESGKSQNELANLFGVDFKGRATTPFKTKGKIAASLSTVEANGGSYMELQKPSQWETIIEDANGRPVLTYTASGLIHMNGW